MPEYKSVYFAPDGTWFFTRKECEDYELHKEVVDFVFTDFSCSATRKEIEQVVSIILSRYKVEQRYDWKDPEELEDK
ncbi:MAG: hypothetical protein US20_C0026G0015 [Candidatus Pacebacteria bacterium GW2011_GWF1_36_5]|nr:MAG: hypothetical protein US20_C0026G0015 [Candidatus Pacebacteria bacterium GW2011_GWF1_36_5]